MAFERQDDAHHHLGARSTSVDAHYDMLRSNGYSREKARDWATRATDRLIESQDGGEAGSGKVVGTVAPAKRSRFRIPFPWEDR